MTEIRCEQEDIKPRYLIGAKTILMLPPVTETEEEKRNTQGEIIKSHKEKIVVGEKKAQPTEYPLAFVDGIQKIKKRGRNETNCECEKNFLGDNRRENTEKGCQS